MAPPFLAVLLALPPHVAAQQPAVLHSNNLYLFPRYKL